MKIALPDIVVITGDFVNSVSLARPELDRAIALVSTTLQRTAGDSLIGFTRSRGDGWQTALGVDVNPIRVALMISAAMTAEKAGFATRQAIATGHLTESLTKDLNASTGPVFTESGRMLDDLKGDRRIAVAGDPTLNAVARLADAVSQTWTAAQASAALHLLHPDRPSRAEVAKRLGISRQAVDKSAHGAQLPAILDALQMIETAR